MRISLTIAAATALLASITTTNAAFNPNCNDNVVVYWGQDSYGIQNPGDTANWEHDLEYYCTDSTADVINVSFLITVSDAQGQENLNLANHCETTFPGSALLNCPKVGQDIKTCQAAGKKIILSVGGAAGGYVLTSSAQADALAVKIWNNYLGGSSSTRPFGDAKMDGVDFDIEAGAGTYYDEVTLKLRQLFAGDTSKSYYISGAPECPQNNHMVDALKTGWFDWLNIQFYNNYCSVGSYPTSWNFDTWHTYATTQSKNPNVKILIGAPANAADGAGFADLTKLESIVAATQSTYSSFGGVMLWEASVAWIYKDAGRTFGPSLSQYIKSRGTCGTTPPTSTKTTTTIKTTSTSKTSTSTSTKTSTSTATSTKTTTSTSTPVPSNCPVTGGACTNGQYACSGYSFAQCNNGGWVLQQCGSGTACYQSGTTVYCGLAAGHDVQPCVGINPSVAKRGIESTNATDVEVLDFTNLANPGSFQYLVKVSATSSPIINKWSVTFDVKTGETVRSVSRGTFKQKGNTVTIRSPRSGEPESNMRILIQVNGVTQAEDHITAKQALKTKFGNVKFAQGL